MGKNGGVDRPKTDKYFCTDKMTERKKNQERKKRHKPGDIPLNLLLLASQTNTCLI